MRNHNKLLGRVHGVDGIKTGYTRASGFNLVSSVRRNDRHIVAVVLGGSSGGQRDARMRTLIEGHIMLASATGATRIVAAAPAPAPVPEETRAAPKLAAAVSVPILPAAAPPAPPATRPSGHALEHRLDRPDQAGAGEDPGGEARAAEARARRQASRGSTPFRPSPWLRSPRPCRPPRLLRSPQSLRRYRPPRSRPSPCRNRPRRHLRLPRCKRLPRLRPHRPLRAPASSACCPPRPPPPARQSSRPLRPPKPSRRSRAAAGQSRSALSKRRPRPRSA